ncbi:MAG: dipeptidyl aminopeptidase/acylaminoacyl peptidase [Verrucomicrobiales bacterium]|jgi:dipeptidyl aminopeptidase/acylaminoacyl peptidase
MLAFCSARKTAAAGGVEATLHLLPFEAPGETVLVHSSKESMSSLAFSPDGRWLAFAMRTRNSDYDVTDPTLREPRKIENLLFTMNGEGFICDRPAHVYVAALDGTGQVRNLTPGVHECGEPNWFPDSTQLAIDYNPLLTTGVNRAAVVDLDGNLRSISDDSGFAFVPVVSPEGDRVATIGQDDIETMFQNNHIGILDPTSIGAPRWISEAIDRHWAPVVVGQSPTWTDAGLLGAVEDRGNVHLYRLDPDGDAPELLISGDRCVTGWSPGSVDGKEAIAFSATNRIVPNEIFLLIDGEERALTSVSRSWTTAARPVDGEHFLAPSGDGDSMVEVDAWIYRPKNFDASKRYPMLLNIHGGPFTQYGNVFFDEFQMQVDAGYVVVCSNPRGGSGRHAAWGNAIRGPKHKKPGSGWGSVDYQDVMATVDEALRRFDFIDSERLGVLGGSYGGYMTSWIVTHSDRFAAACSERSANNLLSLEFGSDFAGYFNGEIGPRHFEDPEEYLRMSPVTYVADLDTPLLIIHSEDDLRCPTEQATQLFVSATILEKDVEYWLFPNESHELTRSGSPAHRKRRAEIILEFFDRKLKPRN